MPNQGAVRRTDRPHRISKAREIETGKWAKWQYCPLKWYWTPRAVRLAKRSLASLADKPWTWSLDGRAVSDSYVRTLGKCRASGKASHVGTALVPLWVNMAIDDLLSEQP
jgi:hypothetical protein